MVYKPKAGEIIKMHSWHGVVLDVFIGEAGGTVLRVQTARNVFRGYPPEFIEVDLAPEAVSPAIRADLEKEIRLLQEMRELGLQQMMNAIKDNGQATLPHRVEAVQGKYAAAPTSSDDFARRKQEEIE